MRTFKARLKVSIGALTKLMQKLKIKLKNNTFHPILLAGFIIIFVAFGIYLIFFSHAATSLTADFNNDGAVNTLDLSILATNWGRTSATFAMGDANKDGVVSIYDLSILAGEWGQTVTPSNIYPSLVLTSADITAIRARITAGQEPEASAWKHFSDYYLNGPMRDAPQVFAGPASDANDWDHVFDTLNQDGSKARNLAIAYAITNDQKYAVKVHEYLVAWAKGNTPTTQYDFDHGDPNHDHGAVGYHQSYGSFSFAYAYDLTYNSGVYTDTDRTAVTSWFTRFVDAIQTANDRIASDWWISQPNRTMPYEWNRINDPTIRYYYRRDTYVGGDAVALSQTARFAMAHMIGYTAAENGILNDNTNVLSLQNMLTSALTPRNDGDGVPGHPNPVPHVYIYAANSPGGGMLDYMTYNVRALDILVTMAEHTGWDTAKVAAARQKLHASWSYFARYFGPGAEANPNPTDVINYTACLPRFALAYHEFGDQKFLDVLNSGARSDYSEPQLIGPVTLTHSIVEH